MVMEQKLNDIENHTANLENHTANLVDAVSTTLQGWENNNPPAAVDVPSVTGTIGSTLSNTQYTAYQSTLAENQRLIRELAAAEKKCKTVPTDQGSDKKKTGRLKMKHYCSTHGVNHTHGSADCRKPGPNHNPKATYRNRMGGSFKNLGLYGMWKDHRHNYYSAEFGE